MDIKTKYDLGQELYIIKDSKIRKVEVDRISIELTHNIHSKMTEKIVIYDIVASGIGMSVKDGFLFNSKEEVMEHLFDGVGEL